jgi:polygalacturonase
MGIREDAVRMADDPPAFFGHSARAAHHVPRAEIEAMQLAALQERFAALRDGVAVLKAAADEQGIDRIASLDDGGRLLFPHTVYKSYPVSLLERNRFDQMTKWLSRLTTIDLSGADVGGCDGIDSWL